MRVAGPRVIVAKYSIGELQDGPVCLARIRNRFEVSDKGQGLGKLVVRCAWIVTSAPCS